MCKYRKQQQFTAFGFNSVTSSHDESWNKFLMKIQELLIQLSPFLSYQYELHDSQNIYDYKLQDIAQVTLILLFQYSFAHISSKKITLLL